MQEWLQLVVLAGLANAQLVDTWKNGSIFKKPRAFIEPWEESRYFPIRWFGELVLCSRCLTHWTAIPLSVMACHLWDIRPSLYGWPFLWLAVVGMSRVAYKLAGGDEEKEEEDPLANVKPYEPPGGTTGTPAELNCGGPMDTGSGDSR